MPTQRKTFRVVQPWGPDRARQATLINEHPTAAEAFQEIDRLAERMAHTGASSNAVDLLVVDSDGILIQRPGVS